MNRNGYLSVLSRWITVVMLTLVAFRPSSVFAAEPSSVLPRAVTGGVSAVTATSAVVAGEVDPDGEPATFVFELGVYDGASTRYGIVFSGSAGGGVGLVPETLSLTGLQPGTAYAFRIGIESGYGAMVGEPHTFTTDGVPAILSTPPVLPALVTPPIVFPAASTEVVSGRSSRLTRAQKLKRALGACRKKPKHKRVACERDARKKYGSHSKHKRKGSVKK